MILSNSIFHLIYSPFVRFPFTLFSCVYFVKYLSIYYVSILAEYRRSSIFSRVVIKQAKNDKGGGLDSLARNLYLSREEKRRKINNTYPVFIERAFSPDFSTTLHLQPRIPTRSIVTHAASGAAGEGF